MPANLTFPGVYIEEIPSGVRTIIGVATSITAFIGRAPRGPTALTADDPDPAITITSFSNFERTFGGLAVDYPMSYAVRDFFLNGGSQAIIVRLAKGATAATLDLHTGSASPPEALRLVAASPGSWGNNLRATVDHDTIDPTDTSLFNLTVIEVDPVMGQPITSEKFLNVSIDDKNPRYVPRVLRDSSSLVRVQRKPKDQITDPTDPWDVPSVRPEVTAPPAPLASPPDIPPEAVAQPGTDGNPLTLRDDFSGSRNKKTGFFALEQADLFNLLCIPADTRGGTLPDGVYADALSYCVERRAMLIVDPPAQWATDPTFLSTAR